MTADMKVKLIDCTGFTAADPGRWAAELLVYAKSTRLTQGEVTRTMIAAMPQHKLLTELKAVADSVRTSWEMVSMTFEITNVTRACTHQMVRTRYGVSFAQQAQRVVDLSDFDTRVPATVIAAGQQPTWDSLMKTIAAAYKLLQEAGVPNQDARGIIPSNVYTNIIARYDLRALADLMGKRDNLRAQDEYTELVRLMREEVLAVYPWADLFLRPERTATPALDALLARELGSASPVDKPQLNQALKELDLLRGTWG